VAGSLIPTLLDFFPDTVVVEKWLSSDDNGTDTWDVAHPINVPARVTLSMRTERGAGGDEHTVRDLHFVTAGVYNLDSKDRFTLPVRFSLDKSGSLASRQPRARSVTQKSDENGPHHEKVYF